MKKSVSIFGAGLLAACAITMASSQASAYWMGAGGGHPYWPGTSESCFDTTWGAVKSSKTCSGSQDWQIDLPTITNGASISPTIFYTGVASTGQLSCAFYTVATDGTTIQYTGQINAPVGAGSFQPGGTAGYTIPSNGYAGVACNLASASEVVTSITY